MKKTAFYDIHTSLGAKMIPFAGFDMPLQYSSVAEEHRAVRESVGIFDVSHMSEVMVEGEDSLSFLNRLTTNDVSKLTLFQAQYSTMLNEDGGIIDDLLVYKLGEASYMLVLNAANHEEKMKWIHSQIGSHKASVKDVSTELSLLAVQGPKAAELLQPHTDANLSEIPYYTSSFVQLGGVEVLVSATGYTGSGGFELYFETKESSKIWSMLFNNPPCHVLPCGLAVRDVLRLEMGFCLYGNDIDTSTTPLEAGLGWVTKLQTEFIGKSTLVKQKENGLQKKLVALQLSSKGFPRHGYHIHTEDGTHVGEVTSGTISPTLKSGIALGYVQTEYSKKETTLYITNKNRKMEATVVKLPFV